MTNAQIRGQTWKRLKENWRLLVPMAIGQSLVSALSMVASNATQGALGTLLTNLVPILFYPVTWIGYNLVSLRVWRGQKQTLSDTLAFCRDWSLFSRALVASVVFQLTGNFCTTLASLLLNTPGMIAPFIALGVSVVGLWLSARLFLAGYLFALDPALGPVKPLARSFRMMRRNVWRYWRLMLSLCWWIFLLFTAITIAIFFMFTALTDTAGLMNLVSVLVYVVMLFISPLLFMAVSGLADEIMQT